MRTLLNNNTLHFPLLLQPFFHNTNSIELERYVSQHCHTRISSEIENREKQQARRKLYVAAIVCLIFMVGEIVGGYFAHSLAIMTDAAHLLTDFGSMLVSLFSLWISARPATKAMNFGWHRSEILGALVSVLSIWVVTGVLVYLAIQRLISKDFEIEGHVMLITSGCAVGVNIIMAVILHQSTPLHSYVHRHSHGGGFSYEKLENGAVDSCTTGAGHHGNTSVRAAFVHVIGDLLQSIGVFVAAIIIFFKPSCKIADPISTFLFSIFVLGTTSTILKDVFRVLMEGTPKGMNFNVVKDVLLSIEGVKAMHSLHLWSLTLSQSVLSVHIAIDAQTVLKEATDSLQSKFTFHTTTIQVEKYSDDMLDCTQCQDPKD
uniref:Probable proton-coupled zinc antiporter SLC30A3 n=1 Tax=Callorhinchus milii TaxID=7868 RepID=A0A4W3JIR8_CALMI